MVTDWFHWIRVRMLCKTALASRPELSGWPRSHKNVTKVINFQFLSDMGLIGENDLSILQYADTANEAWNLIKKNSKRIK